MKVENLSSTLALFKIFLKFLNHVPLSLDNLISIVVGLFDIIRLIYLQNGSLVSD